MVKKESALKVMSCIEQIDFVYRVICHLIFMYDILPSPNN